jgi:hypothetical protein
MLKISLSRFEKILMSLLSNPNIYPSSTDHAVVNMAIRIDQVTDSALAAIEYKEETHNYAEEKKARGRPRKE